MFKLITKLFVIQIIFLLSIGCSSGINNSSKIEPIPLNPIPPVNTIYKTKPALSPDQPQPSKERNKFKLIEPKQPKLATKKITKKITNSKQTEAIAPTSYPLIITGSNDKNISLIDRDYASRLDHGPIL